MSYFKCYFHPKVDGSNHCRGCKLPVCAPCQADTGFCPDCTRKRGAVDDLRQLRSAAASKARLASSTTARLRLAIRQVGPIAKRGRMGGTVIDPSLLSTGALRADAWQAEAMAVDAKVPTHVKDAMVQRKAAPAWTYDPDRIAYKGVNGPAAQPKHRRPAVRVERAKPAPQKNAKPFVVGLLVGLAVVGAALVGPGFLKGAEKVKSKPLYTSSAAHAVLADRADVGAEAAARRERAAARKAVLEAAFAEADAIRVEPAPAAAPVVHAAAPAPVRVAAPVARWVAPARRAVAASVASAPAWHPAPIAARSIARAPRAHRVPGRASASADGSMLVTSW